MKSMKITMATMMATALCAFVAYCEPHKGVGVTAQDEAVATAIDEGLTQAKYLALAYGEDAEEMLADAFAARGAYFTEGGEVVRHLADGDIRNVPCIEKVKGFKAGSFLKFKNRNKSAMFKPTDITPVSGRMYGVSNAFDTLMFALRERLKRDILVTGQGKSNFRDEFDPQGLSYSFWPLGVAIHSNDAYAEEVSHFFNFTDPRKKSAMYKGTWSSPDYAKVSMWNEYVAALRGVKVHAFALGINLNESHFTTQQVVDEHGVTNTVEVAGTPRFDTYFATIEPNLDAWVAASYSPVATDAFVLLLAYREAKQNEGKETDNAAYRRFRELCRNFNIARMVL